MSASQTNGVGPEQEGGEPSPLVRHIPIFVEGREEPLLSTDSTRNRPSNPKHSGSSPRVSHQQPTSSAPNSIFNRVKNFPVLSGAASDFEFFQGHPQPQYHQSHPAPGNARSSSPAARKNAAALGSSISQIQNIQRDVLAIMDQVECFKGSKTDKQYKYLDEILTQNLLKLDTIETGGEENIKKARREAIKCINQVIEALERQAELGGSST